MKDSTAREAPLAAVLFDQLARIAAGRKATVAAVLRNQHQQIGTGGRNFCSERAPDGRPHPRTWSLARVSEGRSREDKAVPMATMPGLLSLCRHAVSIDESPVDLEAEAGSVVEVQVTVAQFRTLTEDAVSQRISLRPTV